jgi:hypothetical protein
LPEQGLDRINKFYYVKNYLNIISKNELSISISKMALFLKLFTQRYFERQSRSTKRVSFRDLS